MRGHEDDGVDIISICLESKSIHLIQCKNWTRKPMLLSDIENIYAKLNTFDISRISKNKNAVNRYLQKKQPLETIKTALRTNKKTLPSEKPSMQAQTKS
jgi:hypothetical protein